ncbi:NADH dehydrogenase [ubiquinone] 1 beta subcomplex subunit 3-B [Acorus calamus]|uniref:NADH dehydrogenase [ubiquinone] 1 beta subcomplex subunit 3-B n=1 Tax=Acorus calamus TaxID=4465 RepID=A0AAV9DER3_ACOCL|nr:NADH dehydrogenase [ubiquinone] 1 beta subcomplex subunit 3-B [Acorus calamus]
MAKEGTQQLGHTGEFFRRRDEWRKHPLISNQLKPRIALPGFGTAVVAFTIYCVADFAYDRLYHPKSSTHHH